MAKICKINFYHCIIIIIFSECCISDDYKCIQKTECLCEFNSNNVLDITHIQTNFTDGNITYFFSGCNNITLSGCNNAKLCKFNNTAKDGTSLGDHLEFKPFLNQHGAYNVALYTSNRSSTVTLVCTKEFNQTVFMKQEKSNDSFYVFSPYACIITNHISGGLSTGSTLVILFLIGSMVYLIGGALVLHCIRGARGKEMIPNIDFWQNLPGLVKDGLIFVLNGCQSTAITADSYDRI